jgi:CheY-like chemotaxis protein
VAGQGSTLSFTVPAAPREDDAYSPAIGSLDDSWRVLFVADDPVLAGDLRAIFDHHAIKSFAATDGREAIELCRRVLPDLLVLDVDLPEIDAHAVVDWLRHRERLKALPVVVYTAGALGDAARERLRLGSVTQFLTRDQIPPEEFERRLIKLLGQFPPHRTQETRHESEAHPARR